MASGDGELVVSRSGQYIPFPTPVTIANLTNFDTRNDPFFLYNFDLGLTNLGNAGAVGNLAGVAGTPFFADIEPGTQGVYVPTGAGSCLGSAGIGGLFYNGDTTLLLMAQLDQYGVDQKFGIFFGGTASGVSTENMLYGMVLSPIFAGPRPWGWMSESGGGVDSIVSSAAGFGLPNIHNLMQLGVVRSGLNVSVWINGRKSSTGTILAPTGGTNAANRLFIGGGRAVTSVGGIYYGAKGVKRAYSDEEMEAEYNYTMGPVFGNVGVP
jgi:hypothetical protein